MAGEGTTSAAITALWPILPGFGWAGFAGAIGAALAIAYMAPNSSQILGAFEPVLDWSTWRGVSPPVLRLSDAYPRAGPHPRCDARYRRRRGG
jgi:hypothetical protein